MQSELRERYSLAITKLDELIELVETLPDTKKRHTIRWKYLATTRSNLVFLLSNTD